MRVFELEIKENDTILVIAPHSDDESIGTGGLLCKYPKQCSVWIMTDGRYGNPRYSCDDMINIRKKECMNALEVAGVSKVIFESNEDGTLIHHKDCFGNLNFSKFSMIFLPNPHDLHSDHTAVYQYAMENLKGNKNVRVFLYEVHTPLPDVSCCVDISGVVDKKRKMMECYTSQLEMHPYDRQVEALAKYRGIQNEQPNKWLETYNEIKLSGDNEEQSGVEIELAKYKQFTRVMREWIRMHNEHDDLASRLRKRGYKKIAIYGYGVLGQLLYTEMISQSMDVEYVIDKDENIKTDRVGIPVYYGMDELGNVDVVVITTVSGHKEIADSLASKQGLNSIFIGELFEEND